MMNQSLTIRDPSELMETVMVKGDLAKLSPTERSKYYMEVCRSIGLNPLTKPFEYIILNGKMTLYALRNCTDQLRTIYEVSVIELSEHERDGVFIVTAKVQNAKGRSDMAKGAVMIANLKGEALANAIMKAETKAKRRATLSLCGLGFLDEIEVETISTAIRPQIVDHDPVTGEIIETASVDDAAPILAHARDAAKHGKDALQTHYKALTKSQKAILKAHFEELKATANEADAMVQQPVTEDVI